MDAKQTPLIELPEQEPVAWVTGWHDGHCVIRAVDPAVILPIGTAFYTAPPPQRQWVGLTDEDKQTAVWTNGTFGAGALWADAKLREKNT